MDRPITAIEKRLLDGLNVSCKMGYEIRRIDNQDPYLPGFLEFRLSINCPEGWAEKMRELFNEFLSERAEGERPSLETPRS